MSKKKNIWPGLLGSKIEFSTPTPESFDGSKKQFLLDDEAGMGFGQTYWPHMARCPDCGRFMKKGLQNWARHTQKDCPFFKKHKKASGILRYAEKNYVIISKRRRMGFNYPEPIFFTESGQKAFKEAIAKYLHGKT